MTDSFPLLPSFIRLGVFLGLASALSLSPAISAPAPAPAPETLEYLEFIRSEAKKLRAGDKPPTTLAEWEKRKTALRQNIEQAWGGFPAHACPLEAKKTGEIRREGFRIEKIVFQTRPGVLMTANAYVPDRPGKHPAVLAVHGHWKLGKIDPDLQPLHMGLVKQGYLVLAVDAMGAGERGLGEELTDYHGEMIAGTLWPVGLPLAGLQVYENRRAVDYLLTRSDVDPARIAVTGASGGGNQSMYAGAFDSRFAASVPVCSVGNYQAYLGVGCCMCEVVPGALRFTEEWAVLGMTAPRGLMVINATVDGIQFSVAEAKKSLAQAQPVFDLYGKSTHVAHAPIESKHGYHPGMREAMYGWLARHLKGEGNGAPMPDPKSTIEDPESLRCFPAKTRPANFMTIPRFAAAEASRVLRTQKAPTSASAWKADAARRQAGLLKVLGDMPMKGSLKTKAEDESSGQRAIRFESEPGITLTVRHDVPRTGSANWAVLVDLEEVSTVGSSELAGALRKAGWNVAIPEMRATGRYTHPRDKIHHAVDHNSAEWGAWIGRPLLGQWIVDVRRAIDAVVASNGGAKAEIAVIGRGSAGLVAIGAAALDPRIAKVATVGSLATYVTDSPYRNQRLGVMVPGILPAAGDVAQLAALIAPRKLVVAGGVNGAGDALNASALQEQFAFTRAAYAVSDAAKSFSLSADSASDAIVKALQ